MVQSIVFVVIAILGICLFASGFGHIFHQIFTTTTKELPVFDGVLVAIGALLFFIAMVLLDRLTDRASRK